MYSVRTLAYKVSKRRDYYEKESISSDFDSSMHHGTYGRVWEQ